jgi:pimeloyl-ACP methyl ester carboxylesterase
VRPAQSVPPADPVRRRGGRAAVVAVALGALLLAGCTGASAPVAPPPPPQSGSTVPPTPSLTAYYAQRPAWRDCQNGFQCATVRVPIDYADPGGGQLTLHLIRLPATDPAHRIGSLLTNPGGPGVSGIDFLRQASGEYSDRLRAVFDIVGFDPRGIGASSPVHCIDAKQMDAFLAYDGSPDSPAEEQGLLAIDKSFADGCERESSKILGHLGTVDTARDMDVIRAAVGDARLDFMGASYGTFLGATYAEMFPTKVGRLVLDGAVDPTLSAAALSAGQLGGFDRALDSFLADCVRRSDCPVGPTVAQARQQIQQLVAGSDQNPLPSNSGRRVTQSLVVIGLLYPLYDKANGWPALRVALAQALQGNGSTLLVIADAYSDRSSNGSYSTNQNDATYAINCLDRPDHSTLAQVRADAAQLAAQSPIFGAYFAWSDLPCTVWPVRSTDQPHAISAPGAAPILVVGTTRDPATPYQWAQSLASQLSSGRLLTRVGDGHTAYRRGSTCIDNAVDAYLVHGTLPVIGTVCH